MEDGIRMIENLWKAVAAQDPNAMAAFSHSNAIIRWHCTNEYYTLSEYLRANCEYPGDWCGEPFTRWAFIS